MSLLGTPRCTLKLGARSAVWTEGGRRGHAPISRRIELPDGLLKPSPVDLNVTDPDALIMLLQDLIGNSKHHPRPAIMVLPDLSVRTTLLTLDAVPPRPAERDALIRWRLEKEGAFPAAGAKVFSEVLGLGRVLAVMVAGKVLDQYEMVCEAAGALPVSIRTVSLDIASLLDHASSDGAVGSLSLQDGGFSLWMYHGGRPVFVRTKLLTDHAMDDLAASLRFFAQSHPEMPLQRLTLFSDEPNKEFAAASSELGLEVSQAALPDGVSTRRKIAALAPSINLSSHAHHHVNALRAALVVVSLALMSLIIWDLHDARDLSAQAGEITQAIARTQDRERQFQRQAQAEGRNLSDAALARVAGEVQFANQLIAKRAFSWTRLLTDLEESVPPRISIESISVDTRESEIALDGSAMSLRDLTAFIISLEDHPAFMGAVLVRHRVLESDAVEFGLKVRYLSGTPAPAGRRQG